MILSIKNLSKLYKSSLSNLTFTSLKAFKNALVSLRLIDKYNECASWSSLITLTIDKDLTIGYTDEYDPKID